MDFLLIIDVGFDGLLLQFNERAIWMPCMTKVINSRVNDSVRQRASCAE